MLHRVFRLTFTTLSNKPGIECLFADVTAELDRLESFQIKDRFSVRVGIEQRPSHLITHAMDSKRSPKVFPGFAGELDITLEASIYPSDVSSIDALKRSTFKAACHQRVPNL